MSDTYGAYKEFILRHTNWTLTETDLPYAGKKVGKVRDRYELENGNLLFVTTDRQSAFDRLLASIPFKGSVLNLVSAWWFERTRHIVANHLVSIPDPNVTIARACTVMPIEFVVRGYITGSTDTSLWTHYKNGERSYCGVSFPDGLKKNQKLAHAVITPTTKEDAHDRPIGPREIVSEGWLTEQDWEEASQAALALFRFGSEEAAKRGLILVDTKYEFGRDSDGKLCLIDEIHTPDSSRYWLAHSYEERMESGLEPENIDKEFLRLWFTKNCDPYKDEVLPEAPQDLVAELSTRYIRLYEMITGETYTFPSVQDMQESPRQRLLKNIEEVLR